MDQPAEFIAAGGVDIFKPTIARSIDTIQKHDMEVDIQVQRATESLYQGHRIGLCARTIYVRRAQIRSMQTSRARTITRALAINRPVDA